MVKWVAILTRRLGTSRADFINYYETKHVKLIGELLPACYIAYRRCYVETEGPMTVWGQPLPDCDAITEVEFTDGAALDRFFAPMADPATAERLAKDEENFIDRSKTRMFTVEVHSSPIAGDS